MHRAPWLAVHNSDPDGWVLVRETLGCRFKSGSMTRWLVRSHAKCHPRFKIARGCRRASDSSQVSAMRFTSSTANEASRGGGAENRQRASSAGGNVIR